MRRLANWVQFSVIGLVRKHLRLTPQEVSGRRGTGTCPSAWCPTLGGRAQTLTSLRARRRSPGEPDNPREIGAATPTLSGAGKPRVRQSQELFRRCVMSLHSEGG